MTDLTIAQVMATDEIISDAHLVTHETSMTYIQQAALALVDNRQTMQSWETDSKAMWARFASQVEGADPELLNRWFDN